MLESNVSAVICNGFSKSSRSSFNDPTYKSLSNAGAANGTGVVVVGISTRITVLPGSTFARLATKVVIKTALFRTFASVRGRERLTVITFSLFVCVNKELSPPENPKAISLLNVSDFMTGWAIVSCRLASKDPR